MSEALNIKTENGTVRLYKQNGELARVICAGAVSAEIRDDEIFVTMQGGKRKVYSVRGFFKRNA
jgi:hypothetical protein